MASVYYCLKNACITVCCFSVYVVIGFILWELFASAGVSSYFPEELQVYCGERGEEFWAVDGSTVGS